ncbi:myotrophin-like [Drosophila hydei]|uniref:Myotrophin-like n=1 Tax=Drosophila hydei TaxID=7224 RepID=A0A6J1L6S1_DROHY|nr:myotrophin-like [Drosophila hydei]XP_023162271.1 myotrophin-like [Drosophila hydei]XP_023162279.1 myotrophin-like [Drosophila hydei]
MGEIDENIIWNIKNGEIDAVQLAFDQSNRDVNEFIGGRAPLHYAADFGQLKMVKYLVQIGADVNKVDKYRITPILAAIWEGHTECVQYLLKQGANKGGTTPTGQNYVEAAEKVEIKKLLMDPNIG